MPMSIYCLRWFGISYKMGQRRRRRVRGTGYWVIVSMGVSLTIPKFSPLQISPKKEGQEEQEEGVQGGLRDGQEPIGWHLCFCRDYKDGSPQH